MHILYSIHVLALGTCVIQTAYLISGQQVHVIASYSFLLNNGLMPKLAFGWWYTWTAIDFRNSKYISRFMVAIMTCTDRRFNPDLALSVKVAPGSTFCIVPGLIQTMLDWDLKTLIKSKHISKHLMFVFLWPLLLTWFNFNPSIDK